MTKEEVKNQIQIFKEIGYSSPGKDSFRNLDNFMRDFLDFIKNGHNGTQHAYSLDISNVREKISNARKTDYDSFIEMKEEMYNKILRQILESPF